MTKPLMGVKMGGSSVWVILKTSQTALNNLFLIPYFKNALF
ncbi:hypothetical protein OUG_0907 [Helicobacter pylori R32b]|nr:hypothetical protein OUG_0907 [Helicobacter pylori R32b]